MARFGNHVRARNSLNTEDLWLKPKKEWINESREECYNLIQVCNILYPAVIENKELFPLYWIN